MFKYRDEKTGMVLILNMATQSDAESEQAERLIAELGKTLAAVAIMTPTVRRVLLGSLASEVQAFSQAQRLNIIDLVRSGPTSVVAHGDGSSIELDMKVWGQYQGPGL